MIDLIPGDKVLFKGQEWEVFVTPRDHQGPRSLIAIFRYTVSGRCSPVEDLTRYRSELEPVIT